MNQIPQAGEIYQHFKGKLYRIVALATHTETGEQLVIYQALYGEFQVFARPLSMFLEKVDAKKYPDAAGKDRFMRIPMAEAAACPSPFQRRQRTLLSSDPLQCRQRTLLSPGPLQCRQRAMLSPRPLQHPLRTLLSPSPIPVCSLFRCGQLRRKAGSICIAGGQSRSSYVECHCCFPGSGAFGGQLGGAVRHAEKLPDDTGAL